MGRWLSNVYGKREAGSGKREAGSEQPVPLCTGAAVPPEKGGGWREVWDQNDRRTSLNFSTVPREIELGVVWRTVTMWAGARIALSLLAEMLGIRLVMNLPTSLLFVAIVVFFRALDGKRRNEHLLLGNLAIPPLYAHTISAVVATILELSLGAVFG